MQQAISEHVQRRDDGTQFVAAMKRRRIDVRVAVGQR
jgi:hypothetical protein